MAVKYKLVERGNPQDRTAPKKWYAQPVVSGRKQIKEIAKDIEDLSSLSYGDISNVLISLVHQIPKYLADGNSVKLGDLGSLRLGFSSEGVENDTDFNVNKIKGQRIIFTPGPDLKSFLKELKYNKE